jgi:hypothetical protein
MTAEIDGALIQVREAPSFSAPGTAGPSASRRWSPQQAGSAHGRARARPGTASVRVPPMPSSVQKQIPYSAGIATKAKDAATARALVSFLRSEAAQDVLKRKGMDLP